MKFRRNTHDINGRLRTHELNHFQQKIWNNHGDICHLLHSDKPISFEEILDEVRKDTTNYSTYPHDIADYLTSSTMPNYYEVALSLVRLLEGGFVEMVE